VQDAEDSLQEVQNIGCPKNRVEGVKDLEIEMLRGVRGKEIVRVGADDSQINKKVDLPQPSCLA
jgi:hypothetical protein